MVTNKDVSAADIIEFWFNEITPEDWWKKNLEFDKKIIDRFLNIYKQAASGELFKWRSDPLSALAEIIILDQFPRNMFRDKKESFSTDAVAVCLSQNAVDHGYDQKLTIDQKAFLYMPMMHSESQKIHKAVEILFNASGMENYLTFELKHKVIIDQFGRYPHRNKILKRRSRKEEIEFLKGPNSSF